MGVAGEVHDWAAEAWRALVLGDVPPAAGEGPEDAAHTRLVARAVQVLVSVVGSALCRASDYAVFRVEVVAVQGFCRRERGIIRAC